MLGGYDASTRDGWRKEASRFVGGGLRTTTKTRPESDENVHCAVCITLCCFVLSDAEERPRGAESAH